jgi:hypothetical protein
VKREKYQPRLKGETARTVVLGVRRWHAEYKAMPKPRDICRRHNITKGCLYDILAGRSYKHVRP